MSVSIEQVEHNGELDPSGVQRELRKLAKLFPLGRQFLRNGVVGSDQLEDGAVATAKLAVGAATVIHSAVGSTSGPTTTSTADPMTAVLPQMTITADFGGNPVLVFCSVSVNNSSAGASTRLAVYDDAAEVASSRRVAASNGTDTTTVALITAFTPAAGSRTISVRWHVAAGTATANGVNRQLIIVEVRR